MDVDNDKETLRQHMIGLGLGKFADRTLDAVVPAIQLNTTRVEDQSLIPFGATKLGGSPDLPPGFVWPQWNNIPLTFIGQIRLADITAFDHEQQLPHSGRLYFFYEVSQQPWGGYADRDGFKVWYLEDDHAPLERIPHPLSPGIFDFRPVEGLFPCSVELVTRYTIPEDFEETLALSDEEDSTWFDLWRTLIEPPNHQLLGCADQLQNNMKLECQWITNGLPFSTGDEQTEARRRELAQGIEDWRLLFQVDSDDTLGTMWADVGKIYFWIRKQDLAAQDFSKSWMILQC